MKKTLTDTEIPDRLDNNEHIEHADITKVKRRLVNWIWTEAHDEEIYEIAGAHNIKIN